MIRAAAAAAPAAAVAGGGSTAAARSAAVAMSEGQWEPKYPPDPPEDRSMHSLRQWWRWRWRWRWRGGVDF